MTRPILPRNQYLADAVRDAIVAEKAARERAQQAVRDAIRDARDNGDRAIFEAIQGGVTKASLQEFTGLSYSTLYQREIRHKERIGYTGTTKAMLAADGDDRVTVVHDAEAGTYDVHLKGFDHPDVGSNVTGTVIYDEDGELKIGDESVLGGDPFLADKLWATQEVQSRVNA